MCLFVSYYNVKCIEEEGVLRFAYFAGKRPLATTKHKIVKLSRPSFPLPLPPYMHISRGFLQQRWYKLLRSITYRQHLKPFPFSLDFFRFSNAWDFFTSFLSPTLLYLEAPPCVTFKFVFDIVCDWEEVVFEIPLLRRIVMVYWLVCKKPVWLHGIIFSFVGVKGAIVY